MIIFERHGTKAVVIIEKAIPSVGVRAFRFDFECDSEVYAGLLAETLSKQFAQKVRRTREKEYLEGLKTGRARGKKRDYHFATLEP